MTFRIFRFSNLSCVGVVEWVVQGLVSAPGTPQDCTWARPISRGSSVEENASATESSVDDIPHLNFHTSTLRKGIYNPKPTPL